ncbi:MAG: filamentous hemagglutinin N-terminal domain-containing protein, partial [Phormidium sp.]
PTIMFSHQWIVKQIPTLALPILIVTLPQIPTYAQVVPDQTLANPSQLSNQDDRIQIDGGTQAGSNLFHSFQDFSIPQNRQIHFNNAASIQRIITRVTGANPSRIDGHLSANGSADFLLINPHGIEFGPTARLSLGGLFLATTAEDIQFADGTVWGHSASETPALLTVSAPVGVQFGQTPGAIVNRSVAVDDMGTPVGLEALHLSFLGGDVLFPGGQARSPLSVELASFGPGSFAELDRPEPLNHVNSQALGTIELTQQAGIAGGAIRLLGHRLRMADGAQLLSTDTPIGPGAIAIEMQDSVHLQGGAQILVQNRPNIEIQTGHFRLEDTSRILVNQVSEGGQGGDIRIQAREAIALSGVGFEPFNRFLAAIAAGRLEPDGDTIGGIFSVTTAGQSGDVTVITPGDVRAENGSIIFMPVFGTAQGGQLSFDIGGVLDITESALVNATTVDSQSLGGDITVSAESLRIANGSGLANLTLGDGPAGQITIHTQERVEVVESRPDAFVPTGIFNNSLFGTGPAGDITITTRHLINDRGGLITSNTGGTIGTQLVTQGGPGGNINITATDLIEIIGVSSDGRLTSGPGTTAFGDFPSGNLTLNTRRLVMGDGAIVSTATVGAGDAGTLTVNASDIEVFGRSPITGLPTILVSSSGREDLPLTASGEGGDLRIISDRLTVRDGAVLDVRSLGTGSAGLLAIDASQIRLQDGGSLNAATVGGLGGNIEVRSQTLQLRNGSSISTNAGSRDGGNIRLDTATLVALENSDITANALEGRGGQVSITAEGIFGTEFREFQTGQSDITATSALGPEFSGIVEINTPDVDSTAGLVELDSGTLDPAREIVRDCMGQDNRFAITGRGGMPTDPSRSLPLSLGWLDGRDWRSLNGNINHNRTRTPRQEISESETVPLIEATSWMMTANGQVSLVAPTPNSPLFSADSCR